MGDSRLPGGIHPRSARPAEATLVVPATDHGLRLVPAAGNCSVPPGAGEFIQRPLDGLRVLQGRGLLPTAGSERQLGRSAAAVSILAGGPHWRPGASGFAAVL